jgi:chemotaxis protein CheC
MSQKLKDINKAASTQCSVSLSKLAGCPVTISLTQMRPVAIDQASPVIGAEEIVAGVYLPVSGDVMGAVLCVFPKESALALGDLLMKRKPGTSRKLLDIYESALSEVGNILAGNYLSVMGNALQMKIVEHTPNFSLDMFGAVLSDVTARIGQHVQRVLFVEVEFEVGDITLKTYLLLMFQLEQLEAVLGSLEEAA